MSGSVSNRSVCEEIRQTASYYLPRTAKDAFEMGLVATAAACGAVAFGAAGFFTFGGIALAGRLLSKPKAVPLPLPARKTDQSPYRNPPKVKIPSEKNLNIVQGQANTSEANQLGQAPPPPPSPVVKKPLRINVDSAPRDLSPIPEVHRSMDAPPGAALAHSQSPRARRRPLDSLYIPPTPFDKRITGVPIPYVHIPRKPALVDLTSTQEVEPPAARAAAEVLECGRCQRTFGQRQNLRQHHCWPLLNPVAKKKSKIN